MGKISYRYLPAIIGHMLAEDAMDFSDNEIVRTLSPCVAGKKLVEIAKVLRDKGIFCEYLNEVYPNISQMQPTPNGIEAHTRIVRLVVAASKIHL